VLTFALFATYVAFSQPDHPEKLDEHWRPVQFVCNPCRFCPHLIGHVEIFAQVLHRRFSALYVFTHTILMFLFIYLLIDRFFFCILAL
jgi:hypothetical protein